MLLRCKILFIRDMITCAVSEQNYHFSTIDLNVGSLQLVDSFFLSSGRAWIEVNRTDSAKKYRLVVVEPVGMFADVFSGLEFSDR